MLPKPAISGAKFDGRFDKADFIDYVARDDEYQCPQRQQRLFATRDIATVHPERPTTDKSMGA